MCYTAREQLACDANSSPALPPFWGESDSAVKADIFSGWDFFYFIECLIKKQNNNNCHRQNIIRQPFRDIQSKGSAKSFNKASVLNAFMFVENSIESKYLFISSLSLKKEVCI